MRTILLCLMLQAAAFAGREVAITVDDLPRGGDANPDEAATLRMTAKLLEPFRRSRIPVTGFVNECKLPEQTLRQTLSLWKAAGAELGNHTCSHLDLNSTPLDQYQADISKGERVTSEIQGRRPRYFRHPFLHAGKDVTTKIAVAQFLKTNGYTVAPVTLDNSDYVFARVYADALNRGDKALARRVREAYLAYMDSIFEFFEKRAVEVTGSEIRQILLIHASHLNAGAMPDLLALIRRRGYSVVTLERALQDPAYALPEEYTGPGGFSWIHRWSKTKGMPGRGEPDEPVWIRRLYDQR